jgi:zinc D-Ala-D-Ala carboxypeptidase
MDPIAGVAARMAQIQVRIATITGTASPTNTAATGTATGTSFASMYASALTEAGATTSAATSGRLTADGVPVELASYGNGKIPASALRAVGDTGHKLWAPAAASLEARVTAARRDGVQIGITDSYRPYAEQVDLAQRKGLYSEGGLAAKPGTSDHGWGMAVDLDLDSRALTWMRANAGRFGFVEDTPREPWHWAFQTGQ